MLSKLYQFSINVFMERIDKKKSYLTKPKEQFVWLKQTYIQNVKYKFSTLRLTVNKSTDKTVEVCAL